MNMRLRKFWELLPELFKKKKKKPKIAHPGLGLETLQNT